MESSQQDRIQRARCNLEGLSVGDAFGETFPRLLLFEWLE